MVLFHHAVGKMVHALTQSILWSITGPSETGGRIRSIRALQWWRMLTTAVDGLARSFDRSGMSPETARGIHSTGEAMVLAGRTECGLRHGLCCRSPVSF